MPELLGKGITCTVKGNLVTLSFTVDKPLYKTEKGNEMFATTGGNKEVAVNGRVISVGVNAYQKQ